MIVMTYYQEYDYRIPTRIGIYNILAGMILSFPLFIFVPTSISNSARIATIILGIMVILFGIFQVMQSKEPPKKVIVTDNDISSPKIPLSNTLITINFDEIKKLKISYNPSTKNILVIVGNNQTIGMKGHCFDNPNILKEIKEHIESCLNQ